MILKVKLGQICVPYQLSSEFGQAFMVGTELLREEAKFIYRSKSVRQQVRILELQIAFSNMKQGTADSQKEDHPTDTGDVG